MKLIKFKKKNKFTILRQPTIQTAICILQLSAIHSCMSDNGFHCALCLPRGATIVIIPNSIIDNVVTARSLVVFITRLLVLSIPLLLLLYLGRSYILFIFVHFFFYQANVLGANRRRCHTAVASLRRHLIVGHLSSHCNI